MGFKRYLGFCAPALMALLTPFAPASASPDLSVYGKLAGFEMAAMSPSGDHVALIGDVKGQRLLIIVDKDAKLVTSTQVGELKVRDLAWAGDNMVLLVRTSTARLDPDFTADKAELTSVIVIPLDSGKPWTVFEKDQDITGGVSGFHGLSERDGKWFGYFGGVTFDNEGRMESYLNSTDPVLYEVDLQTRKKRKIAPRGDGIYRNWLMGADGKVGATFDFSSKSGEWAVRNGRGQEIAKGVDKLGKVGLVAFSATSDSVIYSAADVETRERHWFEAPMAGGAVKEILADQPAQGRIVDGRTHRLIGYMTSGDMPSYHFFDAHQDKVMAATAKAFPGLSVHLMDWNDRFDRLIVQTEGVGDPQTWWVVDIKSGKADPIGVSYPVQPEDVGPMKMIHYKAGDGTDIAAVLTLPPGRSAKNLPIVVLPHGGPGARDYPGFDWWAQAFASRGYVVLQPNFRGSTGYGVAFERAGHGEWGRKMQTDISDGLAQLARDGIADPKRACIMGASYGGYAALAGVTLQHGIYRCAVSVAGIGDVQKLMDTESTESGDDPLMRRGLRDELGARSDLKSVSPIRFVDSVDAPVLLIHGKDDTVVRYDQSNDMAAALRRAGKTVEFVTLPGEDHWLSKSATRLTMLQAAVAFVEKYNPADEGK